MDNLHVINAASFDFKSKVISFCNDADNNTVFVLTDEFRIFKRDAQNDLVGTEEIQLNLEHSFADNINETFVCLFEFVVESGSLLIVLRDGSIVKIGLSPFSSSSSLVYKHHEKISSAKLSPDQDIIALADEADWIYLMSSDYVIVASTHSLRSDSVNQPVGVGWGSKETQFFGLDGRPVKVRQDEDKIPLTDSKISNVRSIESSEAFLRRTKRHGKRAMLDWRGDGQNLCTFSCLDETGKHSLRVWNRNLDLLYKSEQLVDMERGILAYVPAGQYICCAQRKDHGINDIVMFEKNGMVHQRITLPKSLIDFFVDKISWSLDSKVLAILGRRYIIRGCDIDTETILLLYTVHNFHYYLKFTAKLFVNSECDLRWDSTFHHKLHVLSSNGSYSQYLCLPEINFTDEESTVAVIDANKLSITPMRMCRVPPPMAALSFELDELIYRIGIDKSNPHNLIIATMEGNLIYRTEKDKDAEVPVDDSAKSCNVRSSSVRNFFEKYGEAKQSRIEDEIISYQLFLPLNDEMIVATKLTPVGTVIIRLDLLKSTATETLIGTVPVNRFIVNLELVSHSSNEEKFGKLFITLDDGSYAVVDSRGAARAIVPYITNEQSEVSKSCDRLILQSQIIRDSINITLGLDLTLKYGKEIVVANSCTSFRVTSSYLIYTTADNHLHFILIDAMKTNFVDGTMSSWSQPIETGGSLVVACEEECMVVLQMPRGNLEVLHPRVLIFAKLTKILKLRVDSRIGNCDYSYISAVQLARRHRLNMNFLADYLIRIVPETLLKSVINQFANELAREDPSLLCLFLSELEDLDTIADRYETVIKHIPDLGQFSQGTLDERKNDKVNYICRSISLPDELQFLQPRVLCFLKMKPRESWRALEIVHKISRDLRQNAIKFILYFINIEQLFLESLYSYDTEIALMVAELSNKDPKEYLVLLDNFNKVDNKELRRFEIDLYLKRYDRALEHLLEYLLEQSELHDTKEICTKFIDLVDSSRQYKHSLTVLTSKSGLLCNELTEKVWFHYARYLLQKRYHLEAALAFSHAFKLRQAPEYLNPAINCYSMANCWDGCLSMLSFSDQPADDVLMSVSNHLVQGGAFHEAVIVRGKSNFKATDRIIEELILNSQWYLAEFVADKGEKQEVRRQIDSSILPLKLESMITDLAGELNTAKSQFQRLKVLMTEFSIKKSTNMTGDAMEYDNSLSEADSECSSDISGSDGHSATARTGVASIKTRKSSKSNKSQGSRQKRINTRPGSRYEDLGCIMALKQFISSQQKRQDEAAKLTAALVNYCPYALAQLRSESLRSLISQNFEFVKEVQNTLWPTDTPGDKKFSLYRRFASQLTGIDESIENVDLEILIRPSLPSEPAYFDL